MSDRPSPLSLRALVILISDSILRLYAGPSRLCFLGAPQDLSISRCYLQIMLKAKGCGILDKTDPALHDACYTITTSLDLTLQSLALTQWKMLWVTTPSAPTHHESRQCPPLDCRRGHKRNYTPRPLRDNQIEQSLLIPTSLMDAAHYREHFSQCSSRN